MMARLEVIGKHATSALYNAVEHKRIPFRFIWVPIAKVQEGFGGKAQAITAAITFALLALVVTMIVVPYPLKMEAGGQVWPKTRPYVFAQMPGKVIDFPAMVKSGGRVGKGQELVIMYSPDLGKDIATLTAEVASEKKLLEVLNGQLQQATREADKTSINVKMTETQASYRSKADILNSMRELYSADESRPPGHFSVRSPIDGVVLTPDFREKLTGAPIKETQPILRLGAYNPEHKKNKLSDWEIELKIPQKHIGQVLMAFQRLKPGEELDVDIMLKSDPIHMFKGKLARNKVAAEATPDKSDNNEAEPVVPAWVRISGKDIDEDRLLPTEALIAGLDVRTRIRCGDRPMGYSLFYGVWEFLYEKIVFFF
jgi:biotin carboxyl carrier protein